jgi:hypothetical protein
MLCAFSLRQGLTHCVAQATLNLCILLPQSLKLELQVRVTKPGLFFFFFFLEFELSAYTLSHSTSPFL